MTSITLAIFTVILCSVYAVVHAADHSYCLRVDEYQVLYRNAERDSCKTTYSVFQILERLRHNHFTCLKILVTKVHELRLEKCSCSSSQEFQFNFEGIEDGHYHYCINKDAYRHAANTFLTNQPHDTHFQSPSRVNCQPNSEIWRLLYENLGSDTCLGDFIRHMYLSFRRHGEPSCHNMCHSNIRIYHKYEGGQCLSEHTVWPFLHDQLPTGMSREQVIAHMAGLYPNGTDTHCVCTKNFDLLAHLSHHDFAYHCLQNHEFSGLFHQLQEYHHHHDEQRCGSHMTVWKDLQSLVQHGSPECVTNLIDHLRVSLRDHGDPCTCHQVTSSTAKTTTTATTTTAATTTTTTTTAATTTTTPLTLTNNTSQIQHCSKIATIEALAKYQQLYPQLSSDCTNQRSPSDIITADLCDLHVDSNSWHPGVEVTDLCDTPDSLYTAVATFTNGGYPADGLAGVFVGCTPTSVKVATQQCGGKFEILELSRTAPPSGSLTQTVSNYHAIAL